jgi:hypothetical protein
MFEEHPEAGEQMALWSYDHGFTTHFMCQEWITTCPVNLEKAIR